MHISISVYIPHTRDWKCSNCPLIIAASGLDLTSGGFHKPSLSNEILFE